LNTGAIVSSNSFVALLFGFSCVVFFFCGSQLAFTDDTQPEMTKSRLIEGVKKREQDWLALPEFVVCYQRNNNEVVTESFASGLINAEWKIARRAEAWYTQQSFLKGSIDEDSDYRSDIRMSLSKDGELVYWAKSYSNANIFVLSKNSLNVVGTDFFSQQGINVVRAIASDSKVNYEDIKKLDLYRKDIDHPFMQETLVDNAHKYSLHPQLELVDGVGCWVLEWKDMDKIWIDPECGYSFRRRVCNWKVGGPVRYEIFFQDFRQHSPGIWVPWVQRVNLYTSIHTDRPPLWGKVASKLRYELVEVNLESAPNALFEMELPAGTIVHDTIRDLVYRVAENGADPFMEPLTGLKKNWLSQNSTLFSVFLLGVLCWFIWLFRRTSR
jgi:hypothetical protein